MLYRLVRPMKRKGSSNLQFIKRIPADLRERMTGMKIAIPIGDDFVSVSISKKAQSIRFSLRTRDPVEVKERQASAAAYLEKLYGSLRDNSPVSLTHRNAVALSGFLYEAWAKDLKPSNVLSIEHIDGQWVRVNDFDTALLDAGFGSAITHLDNLEDEDDSEALESALGPIVDKLLLAHGISSLDALSRRMVLQEFLSALRDGFDVQRKKASGDYSPDPKAQRFPEWDYEASSASAPSASLKGLVEGWWKEAEARGLSLSTYGSYRKAVFTFADFLGHDNAHEVTRQGVIRFKDHLLSTPSPRTGKKLDASTVKDNYLPGLKAVFGWAVSNQRMKENPASGITIGRVKKTKLRASSFRPEEISAILKASMTLEKGRREPWQRFALKRWVPFLCAYTGARVGELVQLRKQDVRREGQSWIITISPGAITVKTKKYREVPIHSHLLKLGFADFIENAPEGYLFMWSGTGRAAWRNAKNRLRDFIRSVVTDPNVQPSHAWRHTFKTRGAEAGIEHRVLDAICGHSPRTVGETYTEVTIKAMISAIERFPQYHWL